MPDSAVSDMNTSEEVPMADAIEEQIWNIPLKFSITSTLEMDDKVEDDAALIQVGKSSVIRKSHVKQIVLNAIVLLKPECELDQLPYGTHHHTHVMGRSKYLRVLCEEPHPWGALDFYKGTLVEEIRDSLCFTKASVRTSVLQQIASGVEHLHVLDRPHGNLKAQNVFVSFDDRNHTVILEPHEHNGPVSDNFAESKQEDVRDLGRLFYFVLTKGKEYDLNIGVKIEYLDCPDKGTAKGLLEKMLDPSSSITIRKILEHPFFWSDYEKTTFLSHNFESISHNRDSITELEEKAKTEVFNGSWKEALRLTSQEKDVIQEITHDEPVNKDKIFQMAGGAKTQKKKWINVTVYYHNRTEENSKLVKVDGIEAKKWEKLMKKARGNKENTPTIQKGDVHDLIKEKHKNIKTEDFEVFDSVVLVKNEEDGGYDKESFYDLLRFFRNKKAHYWEVDSEAKTYFQAAGGYWNFFCSRYPNLLMYVYNHENFFPYRERASSS